MADNHELLTELIAIIAKKLAAAREDSDRLDWRNNMPDYMARTAAMNEQLVDFFSERYGAQFSRPPSHDHAIVMAGIRSTSTSGIRGALGNWLVAAQKRINSAVSGKDQDHDMA